MGTLCRRQTNREVSIHVSDDEVVETRQKTSISVLFFCFWFFFSEIDVGGALECVIRVSPGGHSMWHCKVRSDEEKSKHASLVQRNGFVPALLQCLLRLVKGTSKCRPTLDEGPGFNFLGTNLD
jgi:hypothetical protein